MAFIECTHLQKKYGKKTVALRDLNATFDTGCVVGIFGPNGSGKSTFLKILAGVETSYSGKVLINGSAPGVVSKGIVSYLPEQFFLNHRFSAKKAIDLYDDFYDDFEPERARELIANFNLSEKAPIKTFSKGMREKLHFALTMSRNAKVYLLDEPLGGIDPATRQDILRELVQHYNPNALTIITTHMITEMETLFDRAFYFRNGEVALEGEAETLRMEHGKSLNDLFMEVCR